MAASYSAAFRGARCEMISSICITSRLSIASKPGREVMPDLPTGTVTFLFTDLQGSTRLLQHLGDRYPAVLAEHHRLLRAAFQQHAGHEFASEGDAFCVAFPRAGDAVAAALNAQRALAQHPWP